MAPSPSTQIEPLTWKVSGGGFRKWRHGLHLGERVPKEYQTYQVEMCDVGHPEFYERPGAGLPAFVLRGPGGSTYGLFCHLMSNGEPLYRVFSLRRDISRNASTPFGEAIFVFRDGKLVYRGRFTHRRLAR